MTSASVVAPVTVEVLQRYRGLARHVAVGGCDERRIVPAGQAHMTRTSDDDAGVAGIEERRT